jgi:branched-chain amino acid aminotransferase
LLACLDGRVVASDQAVIPVTDEGLLRGDGVFEVVRLYAGRPFALDEHLQRMSNSAANLRLEIDLGALRSDVATVLQEAGEVDAALRLLVTRGRRRILLVEPLREFPATLALKTLVYAPTRLMDGIKSLSYGANMLAHRLAEEEGCDDALLVTPHGRVLEAPTASVFWVDQKGELCTPPLDDHILASITRDRVMALTEVRECPATTDDLLGAQEGFLASTLREVGAIRSVEDRDLPAVPGPRTSEAAALLREDVRSSLG